LAASKNCCSMWGNAAACSRSAPRNTLRAGCSVVSPPLAGHSKTTALSYLVLSPSFHDKCNGAAAAATGAATGAAGAPPPPLPHRPAKAVARGPTTTPSVDPEPVSRRRWMQSAARIAWTRMRPVCCCCISTAKRVARFDPAAPPETPAPRPDCVDVDHDAPRLPQPAYAPQASTRPRTRRPTDDGDDECG